MRLKFLGLALVMGGVSNSVQAQSTLDLYPTYRIENPCPTFSGAAGYITPSISCFLKESHSLELRNKKEAWYEAYPNEKVAVKFGEKKSKKTNVKKSPGLCGEEYDYIDSQRYTQRVLIKLMDTEIDAQFVWDVLTTGHQMHNCTYQPALPGTSKAQNVILQIDQP